MCLSTTAAESPHFTLDMSDRLVSAGDTVSAGQIIGHVGLTGNTFGYHLHFEVRENGTVVNPRNYLTFP